MSRSGTHCWHVSVANSTQEFIVIPYTHSFNIYRAVVTCTMNSDVNKYSSIISVNSLPHSIREYWLWRVQNQWRLCPIKDDIHTVDLSSHGEEATVHQDVHCEDFRGGCTCSNQHAQAVYDDDNSETDGEYTDMSLSDSSSQSDDTVFR
jgi:hypothetical protein